MIIILNLVDDSLRNQILENNEFQSIKVLNELQELNTGRQLSKMESYSIIKNIKDSVNVNQIDETDNHYKILFSKKYFKTTVLLLLAYCGISTNYGIAAGFTLLA